jgi:hypothetical protein
MSEWMPSTEKPEKNEVVETIGSFRCNARWDAEKGSWDLPKDEQIQAQVVWFRKLTCKECDEQEKK